MITVKLYSRPGCHLCDVVKEQLESLQSLVPHELVVVNIDQDARLKKIYGEKIPVVEVGAYHLQAPISPEDLQITLQAVQLTEEHNRSIDQARAEDSSRYRPNWTSADGFSYWLSKHYLAVLNLIVLIYAGLPLLAPVLMKTGVTGPSNVLYRVYGAACHQLAYRSFFVFGEQPYYPRAEAGLAGVQTYEQATGLNPMDRWEARSFVGNEAVGYKIALCERDIAIYGAILLFGGLFALLRLVSVGGQPLARRVPALPWYFWILLGLVPIGLDGVSQLLSQEPFYLMAYRESTPFLRVLTGGLFGFSTAWFAYPQAEESMVEARQYYEDKLRFLRQNDLPGPHKSSQG